MKTEIMLIDGILCNENNLGYRTERYCKFLEKSRKTTRYIISSATLPRTYMCSIWNRRRDKQNKALFQMTEQSKTRLHKTRYPFGVDLACRYLRVENKICMVLEKRLA
ncbi:hypothetical protein CEXT_800251 [Caerostris extrusa]|uniref:Uncharacterized protein n=1 Tax=Caerostris extrusa TaxID=172846 RepID=A0AAV4X562_CAEEX|nr:hypothetical protein CEXT_800251 [Caerostris extrusa]